MSATADYSCPDCGGKLNQNANPDSRRHAYTCEQCGMDVHELVAEHIEDLRAVAESDGPLARVAQRALDEGGL